ncbi:hypothetical protein [Aeromonas hydrophila]|uniref:hypothetical protein n=1 Tax=Aeromonas hydrophila TaxID=644 RepID=UPI0038CFA5DB
MLQKLYLPEMDLVHKQYLLISAEFGNWIVEGRQDLLEKQRAGQIKPCVDQKILNKYSSLLAQVNEVTLAIETKITEVARSINVA